MARHSSASTVPPAFCSLRFASRPLPKFRPTSKMSHDRGWHPRRLRRRSASRGRWLWRLVGRLIGLRPEHRRIRKKVNRLCRAEVNHRINRRKEIRLICENLECFRRMLRECRARTNRSSRRNTSAFFWNLTVHPWKHRIVITSDLKSARPKRILPNVKDQPRPQPARSLRKQDA